MSAIVANATSQDAAPDALYRRIYWRIMPILFVAYCIAFLDRVNVGFIKLDMSKAIGMDPAQYGLAAGVFFLPYALFEVPSNLLFERVGARKTFLRIMLLWGVTAMATAFVTNSSAFYVMRLLLGLFEAGFFPGMILYLTYWFPTRHRARATATMFLANAVAATIVGPLSGAIMTFAAGLGGLQGWQWVFLMEGVPACLMGFVCFAYLPDRLEDARWLSGDEKARLSAELRADRVVAPGHQRRALLSVLVDPRVYLLAIIYFCATCANYMFNFWLPTIIHDSGVGSIMNVGLVTAIPMLIGCVGLIVVNWSSDYVAERRWHLAGSFVLAALGLGLSPLAPSFGWVLALLCAANFGVNAIGPLFWTLPPTYLGARSAPAGIGFVSMIGILAGFASPTLLGYVKDATGSLSYGLYGIAALLAICIGLVLFVVPKSALRVGGQD